MAFRLNLNLVMASDLTQWSEQPTEHAVASEQRPGAQKPANVFLFAPKVPVAQLDRASASGAEG